jgi:hypothetical protein
MRLSRILAPRIEAVPERRDMGLLKVNPRDFQDLAGTCILTSRRAHVTELNSEYQNSSEVGVDGRCISAHQRAWHPSRHKISIGLQP